ncbi:MAG: hypothetical protein KHW93_09230, partial [Butyricicoccus pullicaecorum]|nr:hypothetical protein [Butyricicoccus pullicaecorum]
CMALSSLMMTAGAADVKEPEIRSGNIYIYNWDGELIGQTDYQFEVPAAATEAQEEAMMVNAVKFEAAKVNDTIAELAAVEAAQAFESTYTAITRGSGVWRFLNDNPSAKTLPAKSSISSGGAEMCRVALEGDMTNVCAFFIEVSDNISALHARIENVNAAKKFTVTNIPIQSNNSTDQLDAAFVVGTSYGGKTFEATKGQTMALYAAANYTRDGASGTARGYLMGMYA